MSMMAATETKSLQPEVLFRRCDPSEFKFDTTTDLEDLTEFVGQDRALEAVQFGLGIRRQGFNLFLLGPAGTGKYASFDHSLKNVQWKNRNLLIGVTYNFESAEKPRALKLPPGRGVPLRDEMHQLVDTLRSAIPSAFETATGHARRSSGRRSRIARKRPSKKYNRRRARKTLFCSELRPA